MNRPGLPLLLAAGLAACAEEPTRAPARSAPAATLSAAAIDRCPAPGDVIVSDLGTPMGSSLNSATDINNRRQVVGGGGDYGDTRAFLWTAANGYLTDLGNLGGVYTGANGINEHGQVVGHSWIDPNPDQAPEHAFLWTRASGMRDLGTLGGENSRGEGINDDGQVVGASQIASGAYRAFLWTGAGGMRSLGTLKGGEASGANDINTAGQVVGWSSVPDPTFGSVSRPVRWTAAQGMRALRLPAGLVEGSARAINDRGQVVGGGLTSSGYARAWLWDPAGTVRNLGTLPGTDYSTARDINEHGQVVGSSGSRAFVWTSERGMRDLGTLPRSEASAHATAINDLGQIVGGGIDNDLGVPYVLLWTLIDRRPNYQTILALSTQVFATSGLSIDRTRPLVRTLERALRELDLNHPRVAADILRDFVRRVEELITAGRLSRERGQPLIDLANCAIAGLGG